MPKNKVEEIPGKPDGREAKTQKATGPVIELPPAPEAGVSQDLAQFPAAFVNKAGRYELIRINGGQAYYSFTNHQEKTVDATMSIITWRKMRERAGAGLKETA